MYKEQNVFSLFIQSGILETAIRATNAQFEDPDILERLDVRLLDIQPGDIGWDVFSLDYKVQVDFLFLPRMIQQLMTSRINW